LQLLDLGLAALMHDIGKSRVPLELLNKRGQLNEEEFKVLQTHSWRGVLALFGMKGSAARSWRAMTVAYEHHMRVDLTGYPRPIRARRPALFSKIVAVADGFDAATTSRVYQPKPWTPADVMRGMRENPKLGFDPVLVKAFINLTGIYPIGTVVGLDTMEIALVQAASTDPNALARPVVRIIFDARGNRVDSPVVSLTERNASGQFLRTITRTENPDRYGIRVSDYFA
jgi:HD-GYP domain-containing protein (c-di-GMP phosphodiesterase class II)